MRTIWSLDEVGCTPWAMTALAAALLVASLLFLLPSVGTALARFGGEPGRRKAAAVLALLAVVFLFVGLAGGVLPYSKLRHALKSGQYRVAEGTLTDFEPGA